jgi:hypothetical protein
MRRILVALALGLLIIGCSSSPKRGGLIRPEIDIEQVVGPGDVGYPRGVIEVQFAMRISNRSEQPVTLRRIEIQSVGGGGYTLRHETQVFNKTVEPNHFETVKFWVRALSQGDTPAANEPVTIRGVAQFDSPGGQMQQFFLKNIAQFAGGR